MNCYRRAYTPSAGETECKLLSRDTRLVVLQLSGTYLAVEVIVGVDWTQRAVIWAGGSNDVTICTSRTGVRGRRLHWTVRPNWTRVVVPVASTFNNR